jgi:hypothetical protein
MRTYDIVTLILAMASLAVAFAATFIARNSLSQTADAAGQARKDWKQRKWFDLYLKANEAYDFFDYFQIKYPSTSSIGWQTEAWVGDWTKLILLLREVHAMAAVFPKNPILDQLVAVTAALRNGDEAVSKHRLKLMFDAVDEVRLKARIKDLSILE